MTNNSTHYFRHTKRIGRRSWRGLAIVILLAIPSVSDAQQQGDEQQQDQEVFGSRLFSPESIVEHREKIGLTDDQMQKVRQLVDSAQATMAEKHEDFQRANRQIMEVLGKSGTDEATMNRRLEKYLDAERAMKLAQLKVMIRIRNVLSEDQQKTLRNLLDKQRNSGFNDDFQWRIRLKLGAIQNEFQRRSGTGTPPMQAAERMRDFNEAMKSGMPHEAEKILDEVMTSLDLSIEELNEGQHEKGSNERPPNEMAEVDALPKMSLTEIQQNVAGLKRDDVQWKKIDWETCLLKGIQRSRDEDKPIMLWVFIDRPIDDERC